MIYFSFLARDERMDKGKNLYGIPKMLSKSYFRNTSLLLYI